MVISFNKVNAACTTHALYIFNKDVEPNDCSNSLQHPKFCSILVLLYMFQLSYFTYLYDILAIKLPHSTSCVSSGEATWLKNMSTSTSLHNFSWKDWSIHVTYTLLVAVMLTMNWQFSQLQNFSNWDFQLFSYTLQCPKRLTIYIPLHLIAMFFFRSRGNKKFRPSFYITNNKWPWYMKK